MNPSLFLNRLTTILLYFFQNLKIFLVVPKWTKLNLLLHNLINSFMNNWEYFICQYHRTRINTERMFIFTTMAAVENKLVVGSSIDGSLNYFHLIVNYLTKSGGHNDVFHFHKKTIQLNDRVERES